MKRLVIIHGCNNSRKLFAPLIAYFAKRKWDVHFVVLPAHGKYKERGKSLAESLQCFEEEMLRVIDNQPYSVIAFSQGGLYLQLWLDRASSILPQKQVLIAPALIIYRRGIYLKITDLLPFEMKLYSATPREFRRYTWFENWKYKILLQASEKYESSGFKLRVPTLYLADPQDEQVDTKKVSEKLRAANSGDRLSVRLWPRKSLRLTRGFGKHHYLIHPKYFSSLEWDKFLKTIEDFLS